MARAVFPMPGGPCNIMHLHSCVWSRHLKTLRHSRSRLTEMWHRLREVRSIPLESREPDGTIIIRPRPHVSGDFCIRKFFYADTKISASTRSVYGSYTTVHTYPIRIRTSQRISQQSMRIKTDTVTLSLIHI